MHHPWARTAIERLLQGPCLGPAAGAVMAMAALHGDERIPPQIVELLFQRALALPVDAGIPVSDPLNQTPLPEDGQDLLIQVVPRLADAPDDQGLGLVVVVALADLWPHVAHEERGPLRAAALAGLAARAGTGLSREQLRIWSRRLGTLELTASPGLERLVGVLEAATAEASYARLSAHLHQPGRRLAVMLGGLAATAADHGGPRPERCLLLAASAALTRIAERVPADLLAILLAQLGHAIWQQRPEGEPVVPAVRHIEDAILSGDGPAAARAARAMAGSAPRFWAALAPLLPRAGDAGTLLMIAGVTQRGAGHAALPPEDAAALAQALAACIAPS